MRTLSCLAIAAALWVPMAAWAQDTSTTSTNSSTETEEVAMPPRIIPKVEFSFGGGAGIGGYLASFPTDPWLMHVGQSDDMKQDYMKFYPPKASLMPAGHAGFFVDFNFTEHWGLITGAELGLYFSRVSSDMLLNVTTNVVTGSGSAGSYKKELWIGSNLPGFLEKHRMFALQIPLMLKYMTPISPAGHQFYIAGGAKFSAHFLFHCGSGCQHTRAICGNDGRIHVHIRAIDRQAGNTLAGDANACLARAAQALLFLVKHNAKPYFFLVSLIMTRSSA